MHLLPKAAQIFFVYFFCRFHVQKILSIQAFNSINNKNEIYFVQFS